MRYSAGDFMQDKAQIMPTSLFLYRIIRTFPAALQYIETDDCIWKIILHHKNSAGMIKFFDVDGQVSISITFESQYFKNILIRAKKYETPSFLPVSTQFYMSAFNLLNYLTDNEILDHLPVPDDFAGWDPWRFQ
ncbi:hypothetical protein RF11_00062 [Thelohanellus kitauei]|uniref:Uncharacterized protein n=1 Tax=Thelohanellus kitauei TaxID=669202 RepID=A0A0C2N359_THEKT|nr:hypothetical protein RF11_00062 [Thelohanellus kitauei]